VRTRAAGEKAQTVERRELRPERIRDGLLEPADHPGAPARQEHALFPRLPQDLVEAVRAPDRERVGRVAARDEDHVVFEREPAQVRRRPRKEVQVRHFRPALEAFVQRQGQTGILARGSRDAEHVAPACEPKDVAEECVVGIAAHRDDLALRHDRDI
jgi:hypothetical protein